MNTQQRYRLIGALTATALLLSLVVACVIRVTSETHIEIGSSNLSGEQFILEALDNARTPHTPENELLRDYLQHSNSTSELPLEALRDAKINPINNHPYARQASANYYPAEGEYITLFFYNSSTQQEVAIRFDGIAYEPLHGWQFVQNDDHITFDIVGPDGYRYGNLRIVLTGEYYQKQWLTWQEPWSYEGAIAGPYIEVPNGRPSQPAPPVNRDQIA